MGPKKGPVATLTPSTPTPDTPRAMRNKARSQSVHTDSTSSTDPPEVFVSRKRAKTTATSQSHIAWKYTWPSFQGKMVIDIPNSPPRRNICPNFLGLCFGIDCQKKKLRAIHAEWSGEEIRTEISGRVYPPFDEMVLMWTVEEV
jgi:hypothetical protein